MPTKTPTSALSATELPIKRVWYRTLAMIRRLFSRSAPPETRPSYFARLPVEILEMVVLHLIYDKRSLLACSLTCHSCYIVAVPHLHHTLTTRSESQDETTDYNKPKWPKPLRSMHKLGLLPLVKKFHICATNSPYPYVFSPKRLSSFTLHHFIALTNVQELGIDHLDIPNFIPNIQRYFGHFSSTVHSLALREPKGSCRQIIYFIGLFKHLEDLKLLYDKVDPQGEPADDPTLVPLFVPPLRGRLTATRLTRVGVWKDMIDLFGGIRFHYMNLFNVAGTRLLLDACAETLETLRLYPTDPRAVSSIRDFDLSQNKLLRTLEVTGKDIDHGLWESGSPDTATNLFKYVLSTITSPVFTEVTAFYREYDFAGVSIRGNAIWWLSPARVAGEASNFDRRFRTFQVMHKVRDFQLVLCVEAWDGVGEYTMGVLKKAVAAGKEKRRFDDTFLEPLVIYSPQGSCHQWPEYSTFRNPWIPL